MTAGRISAVQRCSIHDGPGIRTTVFLKGCPLRCRWCHNPETQSGAPELLFYRTRCRGCGACRAYCARAFTPECTRCGRCAAVCPAHARERNGYDASVGELLPVLLADRAFYETSGGGVTVSGGEPLAQPEFCRALLFRLQEAGVHTALETAGDAPWETLASLLGAADLVLFDLKCIDGTLHRRLTGVPNDRNLANAARLRDGAPCEVIFRMPVVPGENDAEAEAACAFAAPRRVELLAYHDLCAGKYEALGRAFPCAGVRVPGKDELRALAARFPNAFFAE